MAGRENRLIWAASSMADMLLGQVYKGTHGKAVTDGEEMDVKSTAPWRSKEE